MNKKYLVVQVGLDMFCEFAKYADENIFIKIYGESLETHLWEKHVKFQERNMTWTYNGMDNGNRSKMVKYILERKI